MSAPSSLVAIAPAATQGSDPVESRFNQLAKKILDELKQASYSRDFFAALDQILLEPSDQKFRLAHADAQRRPSRLRYKALARRQHELQVGLDQLVSITASRRSSPGELAASSPSSGHHHQPPGRQQQFTSLPVEVTSTTAAAAAAAARRQTTPKTKSAQTTNQLQMNGNPKRSAIPVSKQAAYAIGRSATVGDTHNLAARLTRATGPPVDFRNNKRLAANNQSGPNHTKLAASEKINQRRPTRAKLDQLDIEFLTDNSRANSENDDHDDDFDDDSEDSDDDSDEQQQQVAGGFANLAARRAYLSEKFIKQHKEQQQIEIKHKQQQQQARPLQEISQVQRQKAKFSQKPATRSPASFGANQVVKSTSNVFTSGHPATFASSQQPRSLGCPTSSPIQPTTTTTATATTTTMPASQSIELSSKETLGHLYKPHMNYSTSLLGNHRLSDDDEIIIIPTASPSSLISSSCCSPANGLSSNHHNHNTSASVTCAESQQQQQQPFDGDQEMSERFSISRTKSFWEKLSNTTSAPSAKQASFEQNWTEGGQENNNYQENNDYYHHTSTA